MEEIKMDKKVVWNANVAELQLELSGQFNKWSKPALAENFP